MSTAFRHIENGIANRILIPCKVDFPSPFNPTNIEVNALWDTGATCTCISEDLANRLGLMADDTRDLKMADNSIHTSNVYSVQLTMGLFTMPYMRVCDLPMAGSGHDVIIGMDFMQNGDVSISNFKGKTVLTFREPSLATIDYVAELDKYKKIHIGWSKVGNNQCPCGSKKTWDKCHGRQ